MLNVVNQSENIWLLQFNQETELAGKYAALKALKVGRFFEHKNNLFHRTSQLCQLQAHYVHFWIIEIWITD